MNLKAATLVTSVLASALTLGKVIAVYGPRLFEKPRLRLVRDPIGIHDHVAGALARADGFKTNARTEAEALAYASAWSDQLPATTRGGQS